MSIQTFGNSSLERWHPVWLSANLVFYIFTLKLPNGCSRRILIAHRSIGNNQIESNEEVNKVKFGWRTGDNDGGNSVISFNFPLRNIENNSEIFRTRLNGRGTHRIELINLCVTSSKSITPAPPELPVTSSTHGRGGCGGGCCDGRGGEFKFGRRERLVRGRKKRFQRLRWRGDFDGSPPRLGAWDWSNTAAVAKRRLQDQRKLGKESGRQMVATRDDTYSDLIK